MTRSTVSTGSGADTRADVVSTPAVEVRNLRHEYDGGNSAAPAVHDVSLTVEQGEFFALLGPSGCGKTTTLRCIAGLERPTSGEIVLAGQTVVGKRRFVPTHSRDIGMVFQDYAIWPHMTVFDNVAFPLRVAGRSKAQIADGVQGALSMVGLAEFAQRRGTALSGGQQQRVSLARALVREPEALLLDEPLSNLDATLREQMRAELRNIQQRLKITTVFVTHDQVEALSLASRIALMQHGEVVQIASPRELYERPVNTFAAAFVGTITFFPGTVISGPAGSLVVRTAVGPVTCPATEGVSQGDEVTVGIRPENVRVATERPAGTNVFEGTLRTSLYMGASVDLHIEAGGVLLRVTRPAREWSGAAVDDKVWFELPTADCLVLTS